MDKAIFFNYARKRFEKGRMSQSQVNGCLIILEAMEKAAWPIAWAAYGLATAFHETAQTMQPVKEFGGASYYKRMYDIEGDRPQLALAHGNVNRGDGAKYCGRGYVQITWQCNYKKASDITGLDLLSNPDLAMQPDIAIKIMLHGMKYGWFTGKKNADYLNSENPNYYDARRIINGKDKAAQIAMYAEHFERALELAGYAPARQENHTPATPAAQNQTPPPAPVSVPSKPVSASLPPFPSKPSLWDRMKGFSSWLR